MFITSRSLLKMLILATMLASIDFIAYSFDFGQLESRFGTRIADLSREADVLKAKLAQLQEKFSSIDPSLENVLAMEEQLSDYSGHFFNYRVRRMAFWTEVYAALIPNLIENQGNDPTSEESRKGFDQNYAQFMAELEQVEYYPPTNDIKKWASRMAAKLDRMSSINRAFMLHARAITSDLQVGQGSGAKLKVVADKYLRIIGDSFESLVLSFLERRVQKKDNFLFYVRTLLRVKFWWAGFKFSYPKAFSSEPLPKNTINIFLPPHGTIDEVTYIGTTILENLPKGRKGSLIAAPYHFVDNIFKKDSARALRLGNALAAHPNVVAVLGGLSPYSQEDIERRSAFSQFEEKIQEGVTDFVLFPEGRNSPHEGGFTPIHPHMALALLKLTRGFKVGDEVYNIRVTVLGASLPNLSYRIGRGQKYLTIEELALLDLRPTLIFKTPGYLEHVGRILMA